MYFQIKKHFEKTTITTLSKPQNTYIISSL